MAQVNLRSLVARLNDPCRRTLEAAAGLCLSRSHYNVEIEHWLLKLLEAPDTDLLAILRRFEVDPSRLQRDLVKVLDRIRTGNARAPGLSEDVVHLAREAWLLASLEYGAQRTRSGHVLATLVYDDRLARAARESSKEFEKIQPDVLRQQLVTITGGTSEAGSDFAAPSGGAAPGAPGAPGAPRAGGPTPNLDQYTVDLTAKAKAGQIDPVLGRDSEIRQVVDILTRRRQNNPILTGEAGVGKTAVAEGFAIKIVNGDVPGKLRGVSLRTLDLGLLQAGAGIKGEFENRLKSVIEEVKSSPKPVILFIDEAHQMIGAGASAGQGDAANLLKPALARGELRTIAATTWAEYKKYFERDAALARRFQVVKIEEPEEKVAVQMMRGLVETLEKHFRVRILNEAVVDAVRLSKRYISGRQLPDKSVSLLDTASARVKLTQTAVPPAVEDGRLLIRELEVAAGILEREAASGTDHAEKIADLKAKREKAEKDLLELEARWKREHDLVREIVGLHDRLEGRKASEATTPPRWEEVNAPEAARAVVAAAAGKPAAGPGDSAPETLSEEAKAAIRGDIAEKSRELGGVQGEHPIVSVCVDSQAIATVVADWTGIPVGRMVADEIRTVLTLREQMEKSIVGQSHALEAIAQAIRTSRANMTDPRRPIGVFLFVGTSGTGKTETAITLAEMLYGGTQNMTVINMSEFKEEHKVSLLMGSPPGYVGYGEGGVLTEAVRRKPYSVLLLDEMEKAHPGVQDIFYQVFDKGMLRDGEGRDIDFKNTVIIMTSNAGTDAIMSLCSDPETMPDAAGLKEALHPELLKTFKPAFLGRVTVVPYFPLGDEVMRGIIRLKLDKVRRRVEENYRASFTWTDDLVGSIAERCKEVQSGARNVDHILNGTLLPELSAEFLSRMADGKPIREVRVSVGEGGRMKYDIN